MKVLIKKVKLFESADPAVLESQLNDFLKNKKVFIHDIKYNTLYKVEHGEKMLYSAMVIYGIPAKRPR